MNEKELKILIDFQSENEYIEFKTASADYSILGGPKRDKRSLYGYCVGIGNSGGGKIIFGVNDQRKIVGTSCFPNPEDVKSKIYDRLDKTKISINEITTSEGRVIVVGIPARPKGKTFNFYGIPLTRVGEELVEMTQDEVRGILQETIEDFTARYSNEGTGCLDKLAIQKLRYLYEKKHFQNQSLKKLSDSQFLSDIGLMDKRGKVNNVAIILLGNDTIIRETISNAEIVFEYRNNPNDIRYSDRLNLRKALIFSFDTLWEKINIRNFVIPFTDGLFRRDIKAFNEDVIREGILNSVVHRDYQAPTSIFIKQDNSSIEIKNPGGFILDITPENIYKKSAWRNRRLAETLEKIGLVERSGQGADLIFEQTIKEGKGLPNYNESTREEVVLKVSAVIKDKEFVTYLETINKEIHIGLTTEDLILLEGIKDQTVIRGLKVENMKKFIDAGIVVKNGIGRGTKYFLSKQYYKDHGKLGEYTKLLGLGRKASKALILKHIEENTKGTTKEFKQALNLGSKDIDNLLQELKRDGSIQFIGNKRDGYWVLIGNK